MQIYLLKDLKGHGHAGDIVNLNDGYAKNYVVKNGIGRAVDNQVLAEIKAKKESDAFRNQTEIAEIKATIAKLNATQIVIKAKAGAGGKLFGGITAAEVAGELEKAGITIDRRHIVLQEPIKAAGTYRINVKFNHNLHGDIAVVVEGEENGNK